MYGAGQTMGSLVPWRMSNKTPAQTRLVMKFLRSVAGECVPLSHETELLHGGRITD